MDFRRANGKHCDGCRFGTVQDNVSNYLYRILGNASNSQTNRIPYTSDAINIETE